MELRLNLKKESVYYNMKGIYLFQEEEKDMIEKYYSEKLNKTFDTKEACLKAEAEFDEKHKAELQLKEERAAEAKRVEELYKKANAALKEADDALEEFLKKYKYFHSTTTSVPTRSLFNPFRFIDWPF